jgi:hypothetical protein
MSLWHFHSNATLIKKHYYGYGRAVYKEETSNELGQLCFETQTDRTCTCRLGLTVTVLTSGV